MRRGDRSAAVIRRLATVAIAAALVAACSSSTTISDAGEAAPASAASATAPASASASATASASALLVRVPDTGTPIQLLTISDYTRSIETLGRPAARDCSSDEGRSAYVAELLIAGRAFDVSAPPFLRDLAREPKSLADEFGIEICDITAVVDPGTLGEVVMAVDTPAEAIDEAVRSAPVWGDRLATAEVAGVSFYDWGDGLDPTFEGRSPARPIAEAGQLAYVDGVVIRTRERSRMQQYLSLPRGTLLDRPAVRDVIERLEQAGAYTYALTEEPWVFDPAVLLGEQASPELLEALGLGEGGGGLVRWQMLGLGATAGESGEPVLVVVMAHSSNEDALANVDIFTELLADGLSARFNSPWSEFLTIDQVSADDNYLIAELSAVDDARPPLSIALEAILTRDSLFQVQA